MAARPEILCVGHDPVLNRTRRLILQRCFDVRLASQTPEAVALLQSSRFDLVLLCYSLTDQECEAIIEFVHSLPEKPKILALAQVRARLSLHSPDEEFLSPGPADLLRKTASMAGVPVTEPMDPASEVVPPKSKRQVGIPE